MLQDFKPGLQALNEIDSGSAAGASLDKGKP